MVSALSVSLTAMAVLFSFKIRARAAFGPELLYRLTLKLRQRYKYLHIEFFKIHIRKKRKRSDPDTLMTHLFQHDIQRLKQNRKTRPKVRYHIDIDIISIWCIHRSRSLFPYIITIAIRLTIFSLETNVEWNSHF